jgi:uncharacterized membrane protein YcaP (DUF421 family)
MEILVRSSVVFFGLLVVTRGLGKRELAEMSAFELLLLVTIGDIIQQGITQEDMSVTGALIAVGTFAFWILVLSHTSFHFPRARPLIEGVPVVIVRDGQPLEDVLDLERVTVDDVLGAAREQGIADLGHVRIGVLETDGQMSFLRNDGDPPPNPNPKPPEA